MAVSEEFPMGRAAFASSGAPGAAANNMLWVSYIFSWPFGVLGLAPFPVAALEPVLAIFCDVAVHIV
jgi:hypothetical protein